MSGDLSETDFAGRISAITQVNEHGYTLLVDDIWEVSGGARLDDVRYFPYRPGENIIFADISRAGGYIFPPFEQE